MNDIIGKAHKKWRAEITELDEFFGREPSYPLSSVEEHISYELHKQNELSKKLSVKQRQDLESVTSSICGSLSQGFSELVEVNQQGFEAITDAVLNNTEIISSQLDIVNRNLEQINSTLDWGFSALIEQLTLTNQRLDTIIHLLNIPDSQKQRKYHIEKGFEFMKKSNSDPIFFADAKEHFEKAIEIEKSDYLSLQQLGIIHLYSADLLNFELSEEYFRNSIRYSNSEIGFARNTQFPSTFHFTYNPSKITATSLMHLGRNYYKRENYQLAYETALKGVKIYDMIELNFDLSKYSCILNNKQNTLLYLNKAIKKDRYITLKTLNDRDGIFIKESYVINFLKNLQVEATSLAQKNLIELKSMAQKNSIYKTELENIESLVDKNEYLSSLKSLEKIGFELPN